MFGRNEVEVRRIKDEEGLRERRELYRGYRKGNRGLGSNLPHSPKPSFNR